ncbi:MAG TPA: glutamate-1-semialdehyde 2,1-aminomutase [Armatimonadota bacterium]|nr:glutamate-1-semialdehyde 2,1-aminomutase [Armatimonadota bacterium]
MNHSQSRTLFDRAVRVTPGGVNSPVRAFKSVGGNPLFIQRASGCRLEDVDGNEYIDYVGSWGPMILGHAHPKVLEAVHAAVDRGTSYGAPTELEVRLAEKIVAAVPSVEVVRLVNSGTEAVMSALRLARGFTGREKILKFDGCYHGHSDGLLAKAGSGLATLGIPDSPGVPASFAALTLSVPFNDLEAVEAVFRADGTEIAAVIVEPVAGNMGCIPPEPGFLEGLRAVTARYGALLVLDEVMTGFRLAYGGAQERFGITPDLTTLGKVVGGGFPLAAYGGRREIMEKMAPAGPVYQAGTLSGNPVAVSAGLAQLELLEDGSAYETLERRGAQLEAGLVEAAREAGVTWTVQRVGSMITAFFMDTPPRSYDEVRRSDAARFGAFFRAMLERGVYLPPSQFEAAFISTAHAEADIARTVDAARECLKRVA